MTDPARDLLNRRSVLQLGHSLDDCIPSADEVMAEQLAGAQALLRRDMTGAPRWSMAGLDALVGPMVPGDLVVVGAIMANGKSALLMSQMDAFARANIPTLYVPLEVDPKVCRLRWAAWRLELDPKLVVRGEISGQAKDAMDAVLSEQTLSRLIQFATPKRITYKGLVRWCTWAKQEFGARVVMLDHLHRMDFGTDHQNHRVTITDVVRKLKDLARELDMVLIAAAQLNRSSDPIDRYTPPLLSRLKETAAIAEEADVVLMLSRKLRRDMPDGWQQMLRLGQITEPELGEANVMVATCRKHRLDDSAQEMRVLLRVERGRVV